MKNTLNDVLFIKSISLKEDIKPQAFDNYPLNINALRFFQKLNITKPVLIFNGENGCGKSTLIEAIADFLGIPINGGSTNLSCIVENSILTENHHSVLANYILVGKSFNKPYRNFFFRAESFHEIASMVDNDNYIEKSNYSSKKLLKQSHGESFMDLIEHQFINNSLYILDEPESALSPENQIKLLCIINYLSKNGSQFIIATHSPILLAYRDAQLINLDGGMKSINYKETNVYNLYRRFLNDPDSYQKSLFEEDSND